MKYRIHYPIGSAMEIEATERREDEHWVEFVLESGMVLGFDKSIKVEDVGST